MEKKFQETHQWIYSNNNNTKYDTWFDWGVNDNIDISQFKEIISGVNSSEFNPDFLSPFLQEILSKIKTNKVLDYGAGLGRNLPLLKKYSNDIDYIDLEQYQKNYIEYINNLDYNETYFIEMTPDCLIGKKYDLIYCSVVLQHIIDDDIYEKIVKILSNSCDYLFLVQNMSPIKNVFFKYFELEVEEITDVYFGVNHRYGLYKTKNPSYDGFCFWWKCGDSNPGVTCITY
jgi:SAM-dependent methyltransferase